MPEETQSIKQTQNLSEQMTSISTFPSVTVLNRLLEGIEQPFTQIVHVLIECVFVCIDKLMQNHVFIT